MVIPLVIVSNVI